MTQMNVLGDNSELSVSIVKSDQEQQKSYTDKAKSVSDRINIRECWHCGCQHEYHRKDLSLPALGEIFSKCSKSNHFASKCHSARIITLQRSVRVVDEDTKEGK